jgi:hypothetical protein
MQTEKRARLNLPNSLRIPGETILQTKKCYIFTLIRIREKISKERKVEKFTEAFMDDRSITLALNEKKSRWQGSWDVLLGTLQSKVFKKTIKDDVKREDKIKENNQLFQIREEKKQAKKDKAKKGDSNKGKAKKGKGKFYCNATSFSGPSGIGKN